MKFYSIDYLQMQSNINDYLKYIVIFSTLFILIVVFSLYMRHRLQTKYNKVGPGDTVFNCSNKSYGKRKSGPLICNGPGSKLCAGGNYRGRNLQRIYIGSSIYSGTNHMDSFGLRS